MKRLALLLSLSITLLVPLIATTNVAASPTQGSSSFLPVCSNPNITSNPGIANSSVCSDVNSQNSNNNIFITILRDVIDVISFAVGVTAVYIIIIAAIRTVSSGGDAKVAADARRGIFGALAGIIVVVFAQTFVIFVLDRIK